MTSDVITEKGKKQLDIRFVLDRLMMASPYGERLRRSLPLYTVGQSAELSAQYDLLERMLDMTARKRGEVTALQDILAHFKEISGSLERVMNGAVLSITELQEVKYTCHMLEKLRDAMEKIHWAEEIGAYELKSVEKIISLLDPDAEGTTTFHIYSSYAESLQNVRLALEKTEKHIGQQKKEILRQLIAERYPVTDGGFIRVPLADGALFEKAAHDQRLTYRSDTGNAKVFIVANPPMLQKETQQLRLQEAEEEAKVRGELTRKLMAHEPVIRQNLAYVAQIDFLLAKAQLTRGFRLTRPELIEAPAYPVIEGGRHLTVEHTVRKAKGTYMPVDLALDEPICMVTGANMGGKTVTLKMVGLVQMMAQYGLFVPCKKAKLRLYDRIFVSIGDHQNIDLGLSTFGSEILDMKQAMATSFERGLFLVDELARGTNPSEGVAITQALIEHLCKMPVDAVFTTHLDGLTSMKHMTHYQVIGISGADLKAIKDQMMSGGVEILHQQMDYRLKKELSNKEIPKEAIRVSELLGLQQEIIDRARALLKGEE